MHRYRAAVTSFLDRLRRGDVGAAAVFVAAGILVSRLLGIIRDMVFAGLLALQAVSLVLQSALFLAGATDSRGRVDGEERHPA